MNVQLYAYENGTRYELDLYPEQPIKITLSAEEITDPTQVNSTFSRQFRIPATNNNSKYFRYWYTSGVLDFDVTQKITADIYVDGIRYTTGQLRLIGAYQNDTEDRIDFEVVFLGETKTFSSQVGDLYMNSIDAIDLAHVLTLQYLEESWTDPWNATETYFVNQEVWYQDYMFASTQSGNTGNVPSIGSAFWTQQQGGPRTNPEFLRYVLASRGGNYDDNGVLLAVPGNDEPSETAVDTSAGVGFPETHGNAFTKVAHPLFLTQFTPIVQVKYLVDKIFESTDYSYTVDSEFNEEWFKDLYVDGIATGFPFTPSGDGLFNATKGVEYDIPNFTPIVFPTVNQNNANAYSSVTGTYTIPVDGVYTFGVELTGRQSSTSQSDDPYVELGIYRDGSVIASDTQLGVEGQTNFFDFLPGDVTYTGNFFAGQEITVILNSFYGDSDLFGLDNQFYATLTPSQITVNDMLKTDLKQIDFFRSILTKFRMVMVPTIENANIFTIKPWQDYIGSGDEFDWTYKLDHNKDIRMQPLFYDQKSDITFTDQEDVDVTNKYQQDTFGAVYGRRLFVSGNELLSDTREIETEFAPTPVSQIEGLKDIDTQFIIPRFYENGDELSDHGHVQHIPITPVQRLLFWNGLQPTTTNVGTTPSGQNQQVRWYYTDGNTVKNSSQFPLLSGTDYRYPRCSYLTEIPTTNTTFNLNWKTQFSYFSYIDPVTENVEDSGQLGESVYDRYWKQYIANQYSPNARKMTAYFNLTSEDLRTLTFDDVIFIKDDYWRIQKVYDAPLGEVATVKVELIKLLSNTSGNPAPPAPGLYEYNVQFCNGQGQAWLTSPNAILQGTIMRGNVEDELTGQITLECVIVGQEQARPQGGDLGVLIDGTTYATCEDCA
jgi:hypothetical protein